MTRLEVKRLSGPARRQPRLEEISLTVESGRIAAVFGRSQSGKRLLLRVLSGLDAHTAGDIFLNDSSVQHLPAHHRRIAAVFRDTPMFPGTVAENVMYGLDRVRWPARDRERRVAEVLELVGMTGTEQQRANTLPDAERWRVAIARAIAPAPPALLIESPVWPVDEVARPDFRAVLRAVLKSIQVTTVIATDDLRDAVSMADDLHVMDEGRILQSGELSRVLAGPASITVAEMVGYHTLIRGEVSGSWIQEPGVGAVAFPTGFPLSGNARALAHPSVMLGVPEGTGLDVGVTGSVERVRATGPTHLLDLRVGDRLIEVRWEWDATPPMLGARIGIAVTPGTLRFFNDHTPRPVDAAPATSASTEAETLDLRPREDWRGRQATPEPPEENATATASTIAPTIALDVTPGIEPAVGEDSPATPPEWSAEWRAAAAAEDVPNLVETPGLDPAEDVPAVEAIEAPAAEDVDVTWSPEPWPDTEPTLVDDIPVSPPVQAASTLDPWTGEPEPLAARDETPALEMDAFELPAAPTPVLPPPMEPVEPASNVEPADEPDTSPLLAPWVSASRPPSPVAAPPPADAPPTPADTIAPDEPSSTPRPDSSRRHQGMPLD